MTKGRNGIRQRKVKEEDTIVYTQQLELARGKHYQLEVEEEENIVSVNSRFFGLRDCCAYVSKRPIKPYLKPWL